MNLYEQFPKLKQHQPKIVSWGIILVSTGAILVGAGDLLISVGKCIQILDLEECRTGIVQSWTSLAAALAGFAGLGLRKKITAKSTPSK